MNNRVEFIRLAASYDMRNARCEKTMIEVMWAWPACADSRYKFDEALRGLNSQHVLALITFETSER